jgi:SRSO17 transposase
MELLSQLKGQRGFDDREGRSWLGSCHHSALVTAAHGFLTGERVRPMSPTVGLATERAVLLMQRLFKSSDGRC